MNPTLVVVTTLCILTVALSPKVDACSGFMCGPFACCTGDQNCCCIAHPSSEVTFYFCSVGKSWGDCSCTKLEAEVEEEEAWLEFVGDRYQQVASEITTAMEYHENPFAQECLAKFHAVTPNSKVRYNN